MDVRAEMAATVWRVVHADGTPVTEGDTVVILESMKMEIPVVAESGGVITIAVAEGQIVQEGDLLAKIS